MTRPEPTGSARQTPWIRQPERSNLATLRLMTWISLTFGRPVGRLVLLGITAYFVAFAPKARRASRDYLRRALGHEPRLADITRHVHAFASTIHDRVYLLADRFDLFDIDVEGGDLMGELLERGQGALLFGAHLGSFEVVRALGRRHPGLRIALTMFEDNARKIKATLEAINPAARPEIIPLGQVDTMLRVRDALEAGQLVGLLADRSLDADETRPVPLLGDSARLPVGAFRMAAMLRHRIVFMAGLYLGGNRYRIRFVELADFSRIERGGRAAAVEAALLAYARELERCCRDAPNNWFNFYDFWARPEPTAP